MCVQAWAFIIAREVEAPQRFQAIQSHRAAQAILHQQTQYVSHLLETAVVAEDDGRHLLRSHSFNALVAHYIDAERCSLFLFLSASATALCCTKSRCSSSADAEQTKQKWLYFAEMGLIQLCRIYVLALLPSSGQQPVACFA